MFDQIIIDFICFVVRISPYLYLYCEYDMEIFTGAAVLEYNAQEIYPCPYKFVTMNVNTGYSHS